MPSSNVYFNYVNCLLYTALDRLHHLCLSFGKLIFIIHFQGNNLSLNTHYSNSTTNSVCSLQQFLLASCSKWLNKDCLE